METTSINENAIHEIWNGSGAPNSIKKDDKFTCLRFGEPVGEKIQLFQAPFLSLSHQKKKVSNSRRNWSSVIKVLGFLTAIQVHPCKKRGRRRRRNLSGIPISLSLSHREMEKRSFPFAVLGFNGAGSVIRVAFGGSCEENQRFARVGSASGWKVR